MNTRSASKSDGESDEALDRGLQLDVPRSGREGLVEHVTRRIILTARAREDGAVVHGEA